VLKRLPRRGDTALYPHAHPPANDNGRYNRCAAGATEGVAVGRRVGVPVAPGVLVDVGVHVGQGVPVGEGVLVAAGRRSAKLTSTSAPLKSPTAHQSGPTDT